jgi:hypothetical protein
VRLTRDAIAKSRYMSLPRPQRRGSFCCHRTEDRCEVFRPGIFRLGAIDRRLKPEFFPQPVAVGDVRSLHLLELIQEPRSLTDVVAVSLQLGNELTLSGNDLLAGRNMALRQREVLLEGRAVAVTQRPRRCARPKIAARNVVGNRAGSISWLGRGNVRVRRSSAPTGSDTT